MPHFGEACESLGSLDKVEYLKELNYCVVPWIFTILKVRRAGRKKEAVFIISYPTKSYSSKLQLVFQWSQCIWLHLSNQLLEGQLLLSPLPVVAVLHRVQQGGPCPSPWIISPSSPSLLLGYFELLVYSSLLQTKGIKPWIVSTPGVLWPVLHQKGCFTILFLPSSKSTMISY